MEKKKDSLKNRYFQNLTPEQSKEIQKHAIELGYLWWNMDSDICPEYDKLEFSDNKEMWTFSKVGTSDSTSKEMTYKEFKSKTQFKHGELLIGEGSKTIWMWLYNSNGKYSDSHIEAIDVNSGKIYNKKNSISNGNTLNIRKASKQDIQNLTDAGYEVRGNKFVKIEKSEYNVGNFVVFLENNISGKHSKTHLIKSFKTRKEAEEFSNELLGETNETGFNYHGWYVHPKYPKLLGFVTNNRYYGINIAGNWFDSEHKFKEDAFAFHILASKKEVEEKLLAYANKNYPKGTQYLDGYGNVCTVQRKFYYRCNPSLEWITDGHGGSVYLNGKWAKITKRTDNTTPNLFGEEVIFKGKVNLTPKKDRFIPLYTKKVDKVNQKNNTKIDLNLINKKQFKKL